MGKYNKIETSSSSKLKQQKLLQLNVEKEISNHDTESSVSHSNDLEDININKQNRKSSSKNKYDTTAQNEEEMKPINSFQNDKNIKIKNNIKNNNQNDLNPQN